MAWNLEGTYFESCSCVVPCPCTASRSTLTVSEARRANVSAFGIEYQGRGGFSNSDFAWAG